jgi:hypothetical protein
MGLSLLYKYEDCLGRGIGAMERPKGYRAYNSLIYTRHAHQHRD